MKIVDLKITPKEAEKQAPAAVTEPSDKPRYPWWSQLHLDQETVEKLGLLGEGEGEADMPPVGTELVIVGRARVTGKSERESEEGGKYASLDLQITKLGCEPAPQGETLAQKTYSNPPKAKQATGGYAS